MEAIRDRRNMQRQWCKCEVTWCYFNKESHRNAHLLNFSPAGSYLETARPAASGATILIRVLPGANGAAEHPKELRFNAMGEVKWCRELSTNEKIYYGIGVRYHFPV